MPLMPETSLTLPTWPFSRPPDDPFGLSPRYAELQREHPVIRVRLADGASAWLVTGYRQARSMLNEPAFSAAVDSLHRPGGAPAAARIGALLHMDPPEHTRHRSRFAHAFTSKRVRELEPLVAQLTAERLERIARLKGPVDLIEEVALPIPLMVICHILGVPYGDRSVFQGRNDQLLSLGMSSAQAESVATNMLGYMRDVVAAKRRAPAEDLLSDLIRDSHLTDDQLADLGTLLLLAGYENLAGMLGASMLLIFTRPEVRAVFSARPPNELAPAVDELLRYISIVHYGIDRIVTHDTQLGGQLLRAGDRVISFLPAANRDPALSPNADVLDLGRPRTAHLGFGYGPHVCPGHHLAQAELRIILSALAHRFPALSLAGPQSELRFRNDMIIYGVRNLPAHTQHAINGRDDKANGGKRNIGIFG